MISKKFLYSDIDGNHWPDADKGDDLYYAINFSTWLLAENDTLVDAEWSIPAGVVAPQEFQFIIGNEAHIKISTPNVGSYKITCKLTSKESVEQTQTVSMILKVQ